MGLGPLGVPRGVGFMGGSALGLRPWPGWGIGDSWVLFFWRLHAALLGMPVLADVGCQPAAALFRGWSGGGFGVLGALCLRVGVTAGPGGLGPGWCAAGSMGWCIAWARLWCGGLRCIVPPQGGGVHRGGVNGLYLGVLLSFVGLGAD